MGHWAKEVVKIRSRNRPAPLESNHRSNHVSKGNPRVHPMWRAERVAMAKNILPLHRAENIFSYTKTRKKSHHRDKENLWWQGWYATHPSGYRQGCHWRKLLTNKAESDNENHYFEFGIHKIIITMSG